jgi:hypothetical protein
MGKFGEIDPEIAGPMKITRDPIFGIDVASIDLDWIIKAAGKDGSKSAKRLPRGHLVSGPFTGMGIGGSEVGSYRVTASDSPFPVQNDSRDF